MALSLIPNTTCDIYRAGRTPPGDAPDLLAQRIRLEADYERRCETGESQDIGFRYTHIMTCNTSVDVRDGQGFFAAPLNPDTVYVPDKNGTKFNVIFVERRSPHTAG